MKNATVVKVDAKGKGSPFDPPLPYQLSLDVTAEKLAALYKEPVLVVMMRMDKPITRAGEEFGWFVHPVRLMPDGPPRNLGLQIFCRDEEEAKFERQKILADFRKREEDRKKDESERPIAGEVLKSFETGKGRAMTIEAIPVTELTKATGVQLPASELPPDEPLVDIVHAKWQGADGSSQAALSLVREKYEYMDVVRLIRYDKPVEYDGKLFAFGVEWAKCELNGMARRVKVRGLFVSEAEANAKFEKTQREVPQLRRAVTKMQQEGSKQEREEAARIRQLQALADKTHSTEAKKRHLALIETIRSEQRERARVKTEAAAGEERLQREHDKAVQRLINEYFPTVAEVKGRFKAMTEAQMPVLVEELKRAMRVDCARLGVISPFHQMVVDDELAVKVANALKAKSPVKADQIEAVLNWFNRGYENMPEKEWTAEVARQTNLPVNPGGLGKTISNKFGLKSKLKGRPETGSGKNGEG